jgi:FkbM family methyltransferase
MRRFPGVARPDSLDKGTPALLRDSGRIDNVDLYGQEPEALLLRSFVSQLDNRTIIDVGAERGAFAEQMIDGGAAEIHVIEPEPENAKQLRELFRDVPSVIVHEYAISDADGPLELRRSSAPSGEAVTFGHTLLERPNTDEIAWQDSVAVTGRSLASLVASGELPPRVGILKIDTEGHDFAVIDGMGDLQADVVMVEHWSDLPHSLGRCPWTGDEMVSALTRRGFSHYAFLSHHGEFVVLQWDDATVEAGHMGNIVFLHDRAVSRLLPDVLECASSLAVNAVGLGEREAVAARERLAVIEELERERQMLERERQIQATAAAERLALIEELEGGHMVTSRDKS